MNLTKIERLPNRFNDALPSARVVGSFSGGIASAIACYIALQEFENVHLAFMDTTIEHPDTYRFIKDFEKLTGEEVHIYSSTKFTDPESVWRKYLGLNFATGAPCSTSLKRDVAEQQIDKKHTDYTTVIGFDFCKKEIKRATSMRRNYPEKNAIFPLIEQEIAREALFDIANGLGLKVPSIYTTFLNNNCIGAYSSPKGGCVQGGIGYWQKIKKLFPHKYEYMANLEHELTELKKEKYIRENAYDRFFMPVTICKDQRKGREGNRLFLKHYDKMPYIETIDVIRGIQPITVFECNGTCSTEFMD